MGVIKSTSAPPMAVRFSMADIESQAKAMLLRARSKAEEMLAVAQTQAEELKKRAHAEGFETGRTEGMNRGIEEGKKLGHQQALNEHREKLTNLIKTLANSAGQVDAQRSLLYADAVDQVLELAIEIGKRVTKKQAEIDPTVAVENVREAMKLVVHAKDVRIAVHPSQMEVLKSELPHLRMEWVNLEHVELVADAKVAAGGCRIFTTAGEIDGDLDVQLERIVNDLLNRGGA